MTPKFKQGDFAIFTPENIEVQISEVLLLDDEIRYRVDDFSPGGKEFVARESELTSIPLSG